MAKVPTIGQIRMTDLRLARNVDGTAGTTSNTYSVLRDGANYNRFDFNYIGEARQLSEVIRFSQWRGYPTDFEGRCETYLIAADGSGASTFRYYEFPSGVEKFTQLQLGQSLNIDVYEIPGVIVTVGDGTAARQFFCGAKPPPATIVVNCGVTYLYPNSFPPYKLVYRIPLGTGTGTSTYTLESPVTTNEPTRFVLTYNNSTVVDTGYISKDNNANQVFLGRLNNTLERLGESTVSSITTTNAATGSFSKNVPWVEDAFITVYSPLGGRFGFRVNCI